MVDHPLLPAGARPPPVIPLSLDLEEAFHSRPHRHDEAQLVYAERGVVMVTTGSGTCVVPPHRAVWVPGGLEHTTASRGPVSFRTLFFPVAGLPAGMPPSCCVVDVSPLLRELIRRCMTFVIPPPDSPSLPEPASARVVALLLEEVCILPDQPLSLPMPQGDRLLALCRHFLEAPSISLDIDTAARQVALSRRTFLRLFRQETGLSFGQWRQQACILASLPALAAGQPVLTVALDLGYQSPAAFSAMFRRTLGMAPRDCFHRREPSV